MVVEKTNRVCVNYLKIKISNGLIDGYIKGLLIITIIIKNCFITVFFSITQNIKCSYIYLWFLYQFLSTTI